MTRKSEETSFESKGNYFESYVDNMVGVINLKGNIYEMATDILLKESFFNKIRLANRLPEIKVLLLTSAESALGEDGYVQFEKQVREAADGEMKLIREENALSQYIRLICGSEKIVVSGVRGSVIGAFLGAILSTDYRVASDNTLFSFLNIKYETSPQGALGFFLPRYLGLVKAKNIMFRGDPLSVTKALELGLVDDVVPDDIFESKCVEIARKMAQIPPGAVRLAKLLMKCELRELDAYLKMESEMAKLPPQH